jgi:hypothetical protein
MRSRVVARCRGQSLDHHLRSKSPTSREGFYTERASGCSAKLSLRLQLTIFLRSFKVRTLRRREAYLAASRLGAQREILDTVMSFI